LYNIEAMKSLIFVDLILKF